VQARDVMTRVIDAVGPDAPAEHAAAAEVDVLRDRVPPDPRRHVRQDEGADRTALLLLVRGVTTAEVRCVRPAADARGARERLRGRR
jgi:hypothetical protein